MNKGMIISYFDKIQKKKYISSSITQLAVRLDVHRNTLSNWLKEGYYEDETCLLFCIGRNEFISRLRNREAPRMPINTLNTRIKNMQYKRSIAQNTLQHKIQRSNDAFIQAGED
jgi:hypothetical protein